MFQKILLLLVGLSFLLSACKNNRQTQRVQDETVVTATDSIRTAKIELKESSHDFGKLEAGEIVTHTFYFKNTGTKNLVIRNVETSCGCTVPKYDKKPIPPGKEGKIEVEFNSSGRIGKQYKVIHIFANVPEKEVSLKITANIKN